MEYSKDQFNCPVEATLFLIGGKYKPLILWYLIEKPLHYMELQRMIPKATPKMLSQQLHDLRNAGCHVRVGRGFLGRAGHPAAMLCKKISRRTLTGFPAPFFHISLNVPAIPPTRLHWRYL